MDRSVPQFSTWPVVIADFSRANNRASWPSHADILMLTVSRLPVQSQRREAIA
jgi:hypothetical protein